MIDKEKVSAAVKEMTANPDWEEVLMDAPGAANLRIALAFYASKNLDSMSQQEKDEYREFREMLESQLSAGELKYLTEAFSRMGVDAATQHYQELFSKKTPEEQQQGTQEYENHMKQVKGDSGADQGNTEQTGQEQASENGVNQDGAESGNGEGKAEDSLEDAEDESQEVRNLKHLLRTNAISKKEFSGALASLAALGKISRGRIGLLKRQMFVEDGDDDTLADVNNSEVQGE